MPEEIGLGKGSWTIPIYNSEHAHTFVPSRPVSKGESDESP